MNDMIEPSLPVVSVPYDPIVNETGDISSMTAEQYISWVRDQAASMPVVKRCNIDITQYNKNQTKYMPDIDEIPVSIDELLPDIDWKNDIIADFSNLRQLLSDLGREEKYRERKICIPQLKDKDAWHRFCLANELHNEQQHEQKQHEQQHGQYKNADSNDINIKEDRDEGNRDATRELLRSKKLKLARKIGLEININDDNIDNIHSIDNIDNIDNEENDNNIENENDQVNSDGSGDDGTSEALAVASAVAHANNITKWQGVENVIPTTSLLLQIDQVVTQRLLAYHTEWLEEQQSLSVARGKWIYSILAKIDKPLHQDTAAFIRQIYRRCSILRSKLELASVSLEEDLAILNIMIVITGYYFGQSETNQMNIQINGLDNYSDSEYDNNNDDDNDGAEDDDDNDYEEKYEETEMYTLQKNIDIEEGEYIDDSS